MEPKIRFQTTLDAPGAGNVVITGAAPDEIVRVGELKPFKRSAFRGFRTINTAAEVRKVTDVGVAALTVLPNTKYSVSIGNVSNTSESNTLGFKKTTYLSPSVLGVNATERHNMYTSLAYKINNTPGLFVFAGAAFVITTGAPHLVSGSLVGNVVTYAGGAKTALVLTAFNGHSGVATTAGTDAVLIPLTGGNPVVGDAFGANTIATITLGEGMRVIDNAGYYPENGTRGGEAAVTLSGGFSDSTHRLTAQAAVYAFGRQAQLLAKKPVFSPTRGDLISGEWSFDNNAVVGSATYNAYVLEIAEEASLTAQSNTTSPATTHQIIWANSAGGGLGAFVAALNAI